MTVAASLLADPASRERMLIIREGMLNNGLLDELRTRYPQYAVFACDTYLSGIVEVARHPARIVLTGVDETLPRLGGAISGLRDAAGPKVKLLLCCEPVCEGVARRMLQHGADDYLLLPLRFDELDDALGLTPPVAAQLASQPPDEPSASLAEVRAVGGLLDDLERSPLDLLDRLAHLLHQALPAKGVTLVVEGSMAAAGDPVTRPILTEPIRVGERVVGQALVGEPAGRAYARADIEKLACFADLAGRLLAAAARLRSWREQALTDDLSGLPNRRFFLDRLDAILTQARAERFPVTVLMFDVDDFKTYNDRCGHDTGDEIIRVTGQLFREQCREQDVVARFGGDEFAVIFWDPAGPRSPGSRPPEHALDILKRFTDALKLQKFPVLGPSGAGALTISGGLATFPWDATTRDDLIRRADEALLGAKRAGKNRVFLIGEHAGEVADPRRE